MIKIKYIKSTGLIVEAYDSSIDIKLESSESVIELDEESWFFAVSSGHNSIIDGITTKVDWITEQEIVKQELQAKISEAKQYLASTAWYVERLNDPSSGKAIPEDVLSKRAEARALINSLEIELGGN